MKKVNSLDDLVGFYIKLGYNGFELKKMLEKDNRYEILLRKRQKDLTKKFGIKKTEMKSYVLLTDKDVSILKICKDLEKLKLSKEDKALVKLIKTQLEEDWRKPLINRLDLLLRKYKKR